MRDLTLVVPCFNEAARLDLTAFQAAVRGDPGLGVLFVDDGSHDETAARLGEFCRRVDGLALLRLPENRGKGEAVRAGMLQALAAGGTWAGYWDADLSTPLSAAREMADVLGRRPALLAVFGSRVRRLGTHIVRRPSRHYLGRVFATAVSLTTGVAVYDSQCGAKLFRNGAGTERIFSEPFTSRWLFDVEIIGRLTRLAREQGVGVEDLVYEHPLSRWTHVPGSRLALRHWVGAPLDLARIWRSGRG